MILNIIYYMKKKLHFKNISLDFNEGNVLLTIKEHSLLIILKKKS